MRRTPSTINGVNMNIKFPSIGGLSLGPQASESFKQGLKNKTNEDLVNMLAKDNLSPGQREAIGKELESRMNAKEAQGSGGGGGGEEDELRKLLKKLQDGTISSEEMKQLAGLLGVSVATLEKAKGKGQEEAGLDIHGG
jgi:DNA invertase Pin-like site-specific DNA recombinase